MGDFTNSMTTRMRRTFRYPEDREDDNGGREELDEEEQDSVIKELRKQDEQWDTVYKLIFTFLPLISAAAFVPSLLNGRNTIPQKTLCLLGIASLLATAYTMKYNRSLRPNRREDKTTRHSDTKRTAVDNYILLSNAGACIFLAVMGYLMRDKLDMNDALWMLYLAPGVVLGISVVVKRESSSVDIRELERLRYEYKGA